MTEEAQPDAEEAAGASAAAALHELERREADRRVLRVRDDPAFVLTARPWKESSVIAECFTQRHGRQVLAVRGAKRPGGQFRGLINPFCPLLINYSGAGEVRNLTAAKWLGSLQPASSGALLSGFYVNELVLRFTMREEPQSELFDCYTRTLTALCRGSGVQRTLREFEVDVLRQAGWAQQAAPGDVITDAYLRDGVFLPADRIEPRADERAVPAAVVKAILTRDFSDAAVLVPSRNVLRAVISYYVGAKGLAVRRTMADWQSF